MTRPRVGIAIAAVVGLMALGAAVAWSVGPRDPSARMKAAADRGDWRSVAAIGDAKAGMADPALVLLRARALARLGRDEEARSTFARADATRIGPADLLDASELLLRSDRPALAWLALDAAGKIAPGDARVRAATSALHARIGGQGAIAHVTEHLSAVPDGASLAALVLALIDLAKSDASDDPVLDRVMARDRSVLLALNSPAGSVRLLARVLLETGRPAEARRRLAPLLARGPDLEASWLESRACLQMGEAEAAESALAASGEFARDRSHEPEPALYVGARACRGCHREIHDAQQSGRHATTIRHGADLAEIPLPPRPLIDPADPSVSHEFRREGDKVRLVTTTRDAKYEGLMDYALGSGHRGMTLVGKDASGSHREARISLYSERGTTWDVTSGFSPHPGDPGEYLGKVLSPSGFRDCIHCHVTRFRSPTGTPGPEASDRGIGCERCHGPGGNHVEAMNSGFGDVAIGRLKGATAARKMSACSACHASDGTFPPTDPQFVRFQSTTLPWSKCFTDSGGKLDCVTCHDPHKPLETAPAFYEAKCLSCHGPKAGKEADSSRRVACPVNPSRECLSCHMPRVEEVAPHTGFTDHHIRARRPREGHSP